MALYDPSGDGEIQPRSRFLSASPRGIGLVEPLENPRQIGIGDARPGVFHRQTNAGFGGFNVQLNSSAFGRELQGVVEEVHDHLGEPMLVPQDFGPFRRVDAQRNALLLCLGLEGLGDGRDQEILFDGLMGHGETSFRHSLNAWPVAPLVLRPVCAEVSPEKKRVRPPLALIPLPPSDPMQTSPATAQGDASPYQEGAAPRDDQMHP